MVAEWTLHRKTENARQSNLVNGLHHVILSEKSSQEILELLYGSRDKFSVENISPKFLKVSSLSTSYSVDALMISYDGKIIILVSRLSFAGFVYVLDEIKNEINLLFQIIKYHRMQTSHFSRKKKVQKFGGKLTNTIPA